MSACSATASSELRFRPSDVAHHESRLADQGGGEGHASQRAGLAGAQPQLLGLGDDLGVGLAAVEQVLRHAQVRVEDSAGQALVSVCPPQLGAEAREPLSTLVGQQTLQPHQVDQVPRVVDPAQPFAGFGRDLPGGLHVASEVGQVALGQEQRGVCLVVLQLQARQGGARGRQVSGDRRRPRQPGANQAMQGSRRDPCRLGVGGNRARVTQRHQQVPATREQDRQVGRTGVLADAVDQGQRVPEGTESAGGLHCPDDVRHRSRGEASGKVVVSHPARGPVQRGQRLGDPLVPA